MIIGAAVTGLGALIITVQTRSLAPAALTVIIFAIVANRIHLIRQYRSRVHTDDPAEVRWLERSYVLGASAYLMSIGVLAFAAFAVSDDPFILTLSVSGAVTHALSIAVRNFAIRTGRVASAVFGRRAVGRGFPRQGRHVPAAPAPPGRAAVHLHLRFGAALAKHPAQRNRFPRPL